MTREEAGMTDTNIHGAVSATIDDFFGIGYGMEKFQFRIFERTLQ
jgi:hypothetical protein